MSPFQTKSEPRGRNRRRGAVAIEASLILPLFLIFWFGIIDLGIAFFMREAIVRQVHAAARYAVVNDYDVTKIAQVLLHNDPNSTLGGTAWFSLQAPTISIQLVGSATTNDKRVVISVSNYKWLHFTPFFANRYLGPPITVSMPVEDLTTGG
jgi:Flp pilus assembly protein TadG